MKYRLLKIGCNRLLRTVKLDQELLDSPRIGCIPDVFYYQATVPEANGLFCYRLCFYGGLRVSVVMQSEGLSMDGVLPYELAKRGIPIHVQLGDRVYRW